MQATLRILTLGRTTEIYKKGYFHNITSFVNSYNLNKLPPFFTRFIGNDLSVVTELKLKKINIINGTSANMSYDGKFVFEQELTIANPSDYITVINGRYVSTSVEFTESIDEGFYVCQFKNDNNLTFISEPFLLSNEVMSPFTCSNFVVSENAAGNYLVVELDITNGNEFDLTANLTFYFDIYTTPANYVVSALSTRHITLNLTRRAGLVDIYSVRWSGACSNTAYVCFPYYKNANCIALTTASTIAFYDPDIIIDDIVGGSGTASLSVYNNTIICYATGYYYDLQIRDSLGNTYRFPLAEGNGYTIHDVNHAARAIVNNHSWTTQNSFFYNLTYGCSVMTLNNGKIIYVPYNTNKTKIYDL